MVDIDLSVQPSVFINKCSTDQRIYFGSWIKIRKEYSEVNEQNKLYEEIFTCIFFIIETRNVSNCHAYFTA